MNDGLQTFIVLIICLLFMMGVVYSHKDDDF